MDFIAVDFETATSSCNSACSVGVACVDNLEIVKTEYHLIQPPTLLFSKKNISIHGITPSDVQFSPLFPVVWSEISHYFDCSVPVFAHNARFDMSVLMESLSFYGIDFPSFGYCCSIPFSTKICKGDTGRSLEARAAFFGIDMPSHHNAEADAITCAQIVIETVKHSRNKSFLSFCSARAIEFREFSTLSPQKGIGSPMFDSIDYDTSLITSDLTTGSPVSGKSIVITGEFSAYTRRELSQSLINMGANIKNSVSATTDYLLVGKQDSSIVGSDGLSGKQEKAIALQKKGSSIKILNESDVSALLSGACEGRL